MNPNYDWEVHPCGVDPIDNVSRASDCWACARCELLHYVEFGSAYIEARNAQMDCSSRLQPNMVLFPSTAPSCDLFEMECGLGYYNVSDGGCAPCAPRNTFVSCGFGYYYRRCPHSTDILNHDALCSPCTFPPLPTTTVDGLAVYQYGNGQIYDDCYAFKGKVIASQLNRTACASFQTPKWNDGWCSFQCASGFVPLKAPADGVIGDLPTCKRCKTYCPGGMQPPDCWGGAAPQIGQDGECYPCAVPLPPNTVWTTQCNYAPAPGFYSLSAFGAATPCLPAPCVLPSFFLGCHDTSPGGCVNCSAVLAACDTRSHYVSATVYMDQCVCAPCATAVLGVTYLTRNCSSYMNAIALPCTAQCPTGYFMSRACSLYADARCTPCKPAQPYEYLAVACTGHSDAVYYPCPEGFGCDGSPNPFLCPSDRKALGGMCVCKPGTYLMAGDTRCHPIVCPAGLYPDASIDACQTCTEGDSVRAITVPETMGVAACACPPRYFVRNSPTTMDRIHCWPCGDLECDTSVQRQTGCSGLTESEPACVCALGPAMEMLNFSFMQPLCSARCQSGYQAKGLPS
jgi:hypothetical protein